jgi:tetratricopeptide (TPR) repeat protein
MFRDSLAKAESVWKNFKPLDRPFGFNWNYFVHNFPISQDHLSVAYIKHGLVDRAIEEYNQLIDKDIKRCEWRLINPLYHYRLAKLYQENYQTSKAKEEYRKFIEICSGLGDESKEILDAKERLQILENS